MRTSLSDPLEIAAVLAPGSSGTIGLTLCPGKQDGSGGWHCDLETDVGAIRDWRADIVVSLIETKEFELLEVADQPRLVAQHGRQWVHLPIQDASVPDASFERRWDTTDDT
jgi:ADP-ribosyl-[dinitrogen reductase] hydrolase